MKRKTKKNQIQSVAEEKIEVKKYTIKELLEMGNKTNKIEIAPDMMKKEKQITNTLDDTLGSDPIKKK